MVSLTAPVPHSGTSVLDKAKAASTRPSLIKKRTSSQAGVDVDTLGILSSPSKKSRVHFDSDVEVRTSEDFEKPIDLIRAEVSRALTQHKTSGSSAEYTAIAKAFEKDQKHDDASGLPSRRRLLQALAKVPALLDNSCKDLVRAVLESDWIIRDAEYFETFTRFVVCLISARSSWVSAALDVLISKFARPTSVLSSASGISRKEAQQRVHRVIKIVVETSPLDGARLLKSILRDSFPSDEESTKALILYTHNLLKVIEYVPQLEADILATITDRIAKIDVQVQTDIEDVEDLDEILNVENTEDLDTFMDKLEDTDDEEDDDDDDLLNDTEEDTLRETAQAIRRKIQRMDVLLDLIFEYYTMAMMSSDNAREAAYKLLELHFNQIILWAYRSRHVQFLIFHFAQTSLDFIDKFVGHCLSRALDRNLPSLVRHSAAAYLGSFVARGAHVPARIVRDVFSYIGDELADMRAEHEPKRVGPNLRRFETFYSLMQTLLYIFCFRWRDLEATPSDSGASPEPYNSAMVTPNEGKHVWPRPIVEILRRNINSNLNPLKVCAPVIVEEFAKIACKVEFLFVEPLLAENKRLRLIPSNSSVLERESALSGIRDEASLQLDSYFPFDPYHLPRSKRWLQGDYREWEELPGNGDEMRDSDVDSEDDDDEAGDSDASDDDDDD